jgi:murein DD-endopeptidase MepM/ murein hydrolase activator NlpD
MRCLFFMLIFTFAAHAEPGGEDCSTELCISYLMQDAEVEIFIENLTEIKKKVEVTLEGENAVFHPERVVELLVPAYSKTSVGGLSQDKEFESWSYGYSVRARDAEMHTRHCYNERVCMQVELDDQLFKFYFENLSYTPVTAKIIDSGFKNLIPSPALPLVKDFPPQTTSLAFTAEIEDEWAAWSPAYEMKYQIGSLQPKHDRTAIYYLPYAQGSAHLVTQGFMGEFTHQDKYAIDWAMDEGTEIYAARAGVVADVEESHSKGGNHKKYAEFQNQIRILHGDGTLGSYVHIQKNGSLVKVGDKVEAGDLIGYSGNTGYSSGPHLHFEVYGVTKQMEVDSKRIRFLTESGVITLEEGKVYRAIGL